MRAGTPPEIIDRLSVALAKAAATPEYKKFLEEQFADPASLSTPRSGCLPRRATRRHESTERIEISRIPSDELRQRFRVRQSPARRMQRPPLPPKSNKSAIAAHVPTPSSPSSPMSSGLPVTAALWLVTNEFTYSERPGRLGPTFWPRLGLGLIAASCLYEIGRMLFSRNPLSEPSGLADALDRSEKEAHPENEGPRSQGLLLAGIALVTAYALAMRGSVSCSVRSFSLSPSCTSGAIAGTS